MTKETFTYLWKQAIVKAADDVIAEILQDMKDKYNVRLDSSEHEFEKLYRAYNRYRNQIRSRYFDVGEKKENLIDGHKICACITGALLDVHLISFDMNAGDVTFDVAYSNYATAFWGGIYVLYLLLVSDYIRENDTDAIRKLEKQGTFVFPETNPGHDSYVLGRIKTLALNDIYGNDFDVLTYADMLFWIEKYNRKLLEK